MAIIRNLLILLCQESMNVIKVIFYQILVQHSSHMVALSLKFCTAINPLNRKTGQCFILVRPQEVAVFQKCRKVS